MMHDRPGRSEYGHCGHSACVVAYIVMLGYLGGPLRFTWAFIGCQYWQPLAFCGLLSMEKGDEWAGGGCGA